MYKTRFDTYELAFLKSVTLSIVSQDNVHK